MKLRVLFFVAACTLSVASFASGPVPCKGGQKAVHKGSAVCTPAVTGATRAKTPIKGKAAIRATAKAKAKSTTRSKTSAKARVSSRSKTTASAAAIAAVGTQAAPELNPSPSPVRVDCESTQTLLQGSTAQCPVANPPNGSSLPVQPQANPGTACFAALGSSNAAKHLSSTVPFLSYGAVSPDTLANVSLPNKMERQKLGSLIAGYGMCLDMAASWRRETYAPAVVAALDAYWRTAQSILNELAGGKRTFGDAAKAIAENDKAYKDRIVTLETSLAPTASKEPRNPSL